MVIEHFDELRFAQMQAVFDLRALAASRFGMNPADASPYPAMVARVPGLPDARRLEEIARSTARLDHASQAFHPALALAATLPQEDPAGFIAATAFLLADRLQRGAGGDDLYWHFDAHRTGYLGLPADIRAALMMGFHLLQVTGRVSLDAPPSAEERAARPVEQVLAMLSAGDSRATLLRDALRGADLAASEALWRRDGATLRADPVIAGAARALYEQRPEWDPCRDGLPDGADPEGIVIPFPSALPLPHERAR